MAMTTLHFDLGHLTPTAPYELRVGRRRYPLTLHDEHSRSRARVSNSILAMVPDARVTHFAEGVETADDAVALLQVIAPSRVVGATLDRLVLTAIRLPRPVREHGIRRRRAQGRDVARGTLLKLEAAGVGPVPLSDEHLLDAADWTTASDAAASVVFHHPELLALQTAPAEAIMDIVTSAAGMVPLALSITEQSSAHDADPTKDNNWVVERPRSHWSNGTSAPAGYAFSDATTDNLGQPLRDALERTKSDAELQGQCWSTQSGVTQVTVPASPARATGRPTTSVAAPTFTVKQQTPQRGLSNTFSFDADTSTATISLSNSYLRWLQVTIDQYAPDGQLVPGASVKGTPLAPVDTIMAIPVPTDPTDYSFTFDTRSSSAVVNCGGLGQAPFDLAKDWEGIVCTALFNLAVPSVFIALGVAVDQGGKAWSDLTKSVVGKLLPILDAGMQGPLGATITNSISLAEVMEAVANVLGSLLIDAVAGSEALSAYIAAAAGTEAAEAAEPFVGWIALAIGAAADVAAIIETTVDVARSPATMTIDVLATTDVAVSVLADPRHNGQWPATATSTVVTITYDDGPVYTMTAPMSATTQDGPIDVTFSGLPAGGTITVLACCYSDTGWLAGRGQSQPIEARPNEGSVLQVPSFAITEMLVPLSATTTYTLKEQLSLAQGSHSWAAAADAPAPTDTVSDLDASNVGTNLSQLVSLGLDEATSSLGYLWGASGQSIPLVGSGSTWPGQVFTYQAIGTGADPQAGLSIGPYAYIESPCLAFPPPQTALGGLPVGFLLEPIAGDSNLDMHLRPLTLDPGGPFSAGSTSYGRFLGHQDVLAIHPSGYAVGLSATTCKLQVVRLDNPTADVDAQSAQVHAGRGDRTGLLSAPVSLTCTLDAVIVLQTSAAAPAGELCAFDLQGNPVARFDGSASMSLRTESEPVTVVDVAAESKGYLFVLKYLQSGAGRVDAADYRLDIYQPDGTFLTQVSSLAAARLVVDTWRNLFTLGYALLAGTAEPAVAVWIPSTP